MGAACCHDDGAPGGVAMVQAIPAQGSGGAKESDFGPPANAGSEASPGHGGQAACIRIVFDCENGEQEEVVVRRRPLGVDFKKECPLRVKNVKPGGVGAELDIQIGWVISKINGVDIKGVEFPRAYDTLKKALASVPETSTTATPTYPE
mmetsp:Transcript_52782/g.150447  ORF Transcript_52782/g.150447 Transcript_52782/m.150447 type:complete len:149 (-) Transcript_52782:8-454(-)